MLPELAGYFRLFLILKGIVQGEAADERGSVSVITKAFLE